MEAGKGGWLGGGESAATGPALGYRRGTAVVNKYAAIVYIRLNASRINKKKIWGSAHPFFFFVTSFIACDLYRSWQYMFQPVDELGRFANWPIRFANYGQFATPLRRFANWMASMRIRRFAYRMASMHANECDYNLQMHIFRPLRELSSLRTGLAGKRHFCKLFARFATWKKVREPSNICEPSKING